MPRRWVIKKEWVDEINKVKIIGFPGEVSAITSPYAKELKEEIEEKENELARLNQEIEKAKQEAKAIVEQAKSEAGKIIQEAHTTQENLKQSALSEVESIKTKAYEEGLQKGEEEAKKECSKLISTASGILEQANKLKSQALKFAERDMVEIVLLIANKILETKIELDKKVVLKTIQRALKKVEDMEKIKLIINPEDFPEIQKQKEWLFGKLSSEAGFKIIKDSLIEKGGCLIETNQGNIDATISGQLNEIAQEMRRLAELESTEN